MRVRPGCARQDHRATAGIDLRFAASVPIRRPANPCQEASPTHFLPGPAATWDIPEDTMIRLVVPLAFIAAFSFPLATATATASETTRAMISQVFQALGYDEMFRDLGSAVALGVTAAEERPQVAQQLREAAAESFDPESTLARVVARTDAALSPDATQAVFAFYETPFGREVAALERRVIQTGMSAAAPAGATGDVQQRLEALPAAEAQAPERFALYRRLISATFAEPRQSEFTNAIIVATLTGVVAGEPDAAGALDVMIRNATEATRAMMKEIFEQETLLYAHDSFSTLEMGELERLVQTLETPESAAFYNAMTDAVTAVMREDSERFGQRMGAILRANPG
jgi:hypothetical protein